MSFIKGLTFWHGLIAAAIALALALFVVRAGILNLVAWGAAIVFAGAAVINKLSYGR